MLLYKFKKFPWRWHLTVASLCLAIVALCVGYGLLEAGKRKNRLNEQLSEAKHSYQQRNKRTFDSTLSFTNLLPPRNESDVLVTDIGRIANSTSVQIQSIQVRSRETTELEYGSVEFSIVLSGDYRSTKAWLSDLLSRHRTLVLNTLNMRQGTQDSWRIETQASLVLYVRN